jgi:hypothetical protein
MLRRLVSLLRGAEKSLETPEPAEFPVSLDTAVFTTAAIVEGRASVTRVVHDEDGDYQFLAPPEAEQGEPRMVGLGTILALDPTVGAAASLRRGASMERARLGAPWR